MNNPNYYAIIPAKVRYNKDLTMLERFLYAELTALSNADGYSFPSNKYFSELYDRDEKTISRAISHLEELGYITIECDKVGARITKRKIYIKDGFITGDKIVNGTETTSDKNITREQEKYLIASDKIVTDNNVSYNYLLSLIMYNLPKEEKELIKSYNFSKELEDEIYHWVQYKKEKKQSYKQIGLRQLLDRLKEDAGNNGEKFVIECIKSSIMNNYSGIFPPKDYKSNQNQQQNNYKSSTQKQGPQLSEAEISEGWQIIEGWKVRKGTDGKWRTEYGETIFF